MHLQLVSTIVALAQLASCAPFLEGRVSLPLSSYSGGLYLILLKDTCTTNDLNFPSGGMHGYNGIYWGFLPDDVAGTTMSHINGDSGKKAST